MVERMKKREGGKKKKTVTVLGPCSGDHRWAMEDHRQGAHFHGIIPAWEAPGHTQQWQEARTLWHSQHPLHMLARRGASSCCLPGPHNLDRHRFCAGTGTLSAELPATSDRLPQQPQDHTQPMEPTQQNTEA